MAVFESKKLSNDNIEYNQWYNEWRSSSRIWCTPRGTFFFNYLLFVQWSCHLMSCHVHSCFINKTIKSIYGTFFTLRLFNQQPIILSIHSTTPRWDKTRSFGDILTFTFPRAQEWVSKRENEWVERSRQAKRAVRGQRMSERCERTRRETSTYVPILGCSGPWCHVRSSASTLT